MTAVKDLVKSSAEREKLRNVRDQVTEATKAAQEAEARHDEAFTAYYRQRGIIRDIEERISTISREAQRVPAAGRGEYWQRAEDCEPALREAQLPLMELGQAEEAAKATANAAKGRVGFYSNQVKEAASDVVRAETPAVAAVMADRLAEALKTIAQIGPDLACLLDSGLVGKDVIANVPFGSRALNMCSTEWLEFAAAYRNSPWRGAVAALSNDPDAPLPSGTTP